MCLAGTDARAEGGKLIVKSTPAGASVYLDAEDESRGRTPLELTDIASGLHKLRVVLAGHAVERRGFYLAAGGEREFSLTLGTDDEDAPNPVTPSREPEPRPVKKKPTFEKKETVSSTIDVPCPFCKGSKTLKKMGCASCRSTGRADGDKCKKCKGSRRVNYACPSCKGGGTVVFGGRERECSKCKGVGNLPCPPCKGMGTVKRTNPEAARYPTTDCPQCDATGYVQEAKCSPCSGIGKTRAGKRGKRGKKRESRPCRYCRGDGKTAPVCSSCKGLAYQGSLGAARPCSSCCGTGLAFTRCPACKGHTFVRSMK